MAYVVPPNTAQRWIAGHRSGVRVGIVTFLVVVVAYWIWTVASSRAAGSSLVMMGGFVAATSTMFISLGSISRSVDTWDAKHPERSNE